MKQTSPVELRLRAINDVMCGGIIQYKRLGIMQEASKTKCADLKMAENSTFFK